MWTEGAALPRAASPQGTLLVSSASQPGLVDSRHSNPDHTGRKLKVSLQRDLAPKLPSWKVTAFGGGGGEPETL